MPVPEGPDRTMGRSFDDEAWVVGAIVGDGVLLEAVEKGLGGRGCEVENELTGPGRCTLESTLRPLTNLELGRA